MFSVNPERLIHSAFDLFSHVTTYVLMCMFKHKSESTVNFQLQVTCGCKSNVEVHTCSVWNESCIQNDYSLLVIIIIIILIIMMIITT